MKPAIRTYLLSVLIIGSITSCQKSIEDKKLVLPDETAFCKSNNHIRYGKMKDCEGNEYKTVKIGDQVWMAENLRTTRYRNGKKIPQVKDNAGWGRLTTGAWCFYDNDPKNGKIYGRLYNWYTLNDAGGLAPAGWHVPSWTEWLQLINFLGGVNEMGEGPVSDKLNIQGTGLWETPNNANNESGFSALPGGHRGVFSSGETYFSGIREEAMWWSATDIQDGYNNTFALNIRSSYYGTIDQVFYDKRAGYSIRLVKN